jgi:hypothetical protein
MENEIKNLRDRIRVLESMVKYRDELLDRLPYCNMNNSQALGYMMLACKKVGLSQEVANKIYREMYYMFDMKTEKEAEEQGLRCCDED